MCWRSRPALGRPQLGARDPRSVAPLCAGQKLDEEPGIIAGGAATW
ncbi:hypothetical protein [Sorangium sp. So ce1024]